MLAFLHVPKAAGTSFGTILHHVYPGDGVHEFGNAFSRPDELEPAPAGAAAASGHVTLALLDRLAPGATLATLLREPVRRTLSQHRYLAAGRGRGFIPRGSPKPPKGAPLREYLEGGYLIDNLQTRMLCGLAAPADPLPSGALEQAVANLSRFTYLGIAERFEEFLAGVTIGLGWPAIAPPRARANAPDGDPEPADLRLSSAVNELDRELYAQASELAAKAAAMGGEQLAAEVEVLRAAAVDGTADRRSLPFEARVELARSERELALVHDALRRREKTLRKLRAKLERR
jgi:hypothetical protein